MRRAFAIVICALACGGAFAGDMEDGPSFTGTVMVLDIDGEIEVDRTGRVVSHSFAAELPKGVRAAAAQSVAGWQFVPATTDKANWPVRTKMQVKLVARPGEAAYLEEVQFAVNRKQELETATRPESWVRIDPPDYRVNADVQMYIRLSPSGKVIDAAPELCTIHSLSRGLDEKTVCNELERIAARGIRSWKTKHFMESEPLPVVRQTVFYRVPFRTTMTARSVGEWRAEWRTPHRAAPWPREKGERVYAPVLELRDGFIAQPLTRKHVPETSDAI